jgi:signal transduction histidine kinase
MTGYDASEVIGKNCRFLQADDAKQPAARVIAEAIKHQKGCRVVLRNYRKDGTLFWNEVTLIPICNNQGILTHFMGIQYDISAQRQFNDLQAAYDLINEQMKSIEEQSEELRRVNTQPFESNQRIHDLAALLAHDLQNPVSAMMSFVEVLRDSSMTLSNEERDLYANVAYETAERVLPIVRKLVDLGRLAKQELSPLQVFAFNVSSIAELLVAGYRHRAEVKNITIEADIPAEYWILADENSFYEVIDNLISNALKYTPSGKRIGLRLSEEEGWIRIEIWDEGQGLSEADMRKIFQQGGMLSARPTGGETSTGLGLVAVKSLVKRMNGRVWCESEQGHGARFFVEFPTARKP